MVSQSVPATSGIGYKGPLFSPFQQGNGLRAIAQDSYRETSQEQVLDPRFLEKALKSEDYIADSIGFGLTMMFYGLIGCAFGAGAGAIGGAALANALGGSTLAVVLSGVGGGVAGAVVGGGIGATIATKQAGGF